MKISDFENEAALDLLVDCFDPIKDIFTDTKFVNMYKKGKASKIDLIAYVIKNHKKNVLHILAAMNGQSVEEYHGNLITMTTQLLEIVNDKELAPFFTLSKQNTENTSSSSAMENTEA